MSVSFGFKKRIENKVTGYEGPKDEEPDYLKAVERNVLKSTRERETTKELVIPLIKKNRYKLPDSTSKTLEDKVNFPVDGIEAEAAKEILKESKNFLENPDIDGEDFENLAIPLLLKNKVPDGFETDDRLDVSLRPDEATEAQYDQVPVAAFGMAVLRGMGWTPDEGIGKTFKQNTKMLEQKIRPKGLGLGAEVPTADRGGKRNDTPSQKKDGKSTSDNEDSLTLAKGANVLIQRGPLRNKYGIVLAIDLETARCVVKLAIGGKTEQVCQHYLRVVSKKEYDRNSKDLSTLSRAYTGRNIDIISNGHESEKELPETGKIKRESRESSRDLANEHKEKRRRKHEEISDREDMPVKHKKRKKHKTHQRSVSPLLANSHAPTWVRPQMRVRIIDKSYRNGRYYREKVIVEDVLGQGLCCCKTDDGKILDDIQDSALETVIPKSSTDAYVIIVKSRKGKHNGKLARILEKDKKKCNVVLQLIEDRDIVIRVAYEDMCEYAGDPEQNAMF